MKQISLQIFLDGLEREPSLYGDEREGIPPTLLYRELLQEKH
ncbi:MAG: hypothetical protein RQ952_04215 [Thermoproteota archaeon]|jgi:hypothetical protein|nr:hypothetical protein [Thermoproteota archaeon]